MKIIDVAKTFAEIEHMLYAHGGDKEVLSEKARELARTTTLSLKEALEKVLSEDRENRKQPTGFLS